MPRYQVTARDSFPSGAIIEAPNLLAAITQWREDAIDWVEQVELHIEEERHDRTTCDPAGKRPLLGQ
jgi:hypothetical protein